MSLYQDLPTYKEQLQLKSSPITATPRPDDQGTSSSSVGSPISESDGQGTSSSTDESPISKSPEVTTATSTSDTSTVQPSTTQEDVPSPVNPVSVTSGSQPTLEFVQDIP
ncbi:hypothetical protein L6452_18690 [Arctium lappa]|uniref:Uncharacterized protein n=1 Tax=Arctium lappa TaxID=4217 RepID=A0ACB9C704_ARCLA|nr:hypothetical protein L6452_18690 [Arctium lappa]